MWQDFITQQVFNINSISSNANNHLESSNAILIRNPSIQTDNVSTNQKQETEDRQSKLYGLSHEAACLSNRKNYNFAHTQLNLKYQNAFDLGDSLDKIISDKEEEEGENLKTPETPSCANLSSLNEKIQKSLSSMTFSSRNVNSEGGDSEYGDIFNGFDSGDISFANDVKECMFMQNDPFFADDDS